MYDFIHFFPKDWFKSRDKIYTYVENISEPLSGVPKKLKNVITNETLCTVYVPEIDVIKNILANSKETDNWFNIPAFERTKLLYR